MDCTFNNFSIDFHSFICSIVKTIEAKDFYTAGHSERVADMSEKIAQKMSLSEREIEMIHIAGHLHDIGKIGIPDGILMKSGKLYSEEYDLMKRHTIIGWEILRVIEGFEDIASLVRFHHERPDGKGYPEGLTESQIPQGALILAVADAYDAMTTFRAYNRCMQHEEALEHIFMLRGSQFSSLVTDAFLSLFDESDNIINRSCNEHIDTPHV